MEDRKTEYLKSQIEKALAEDNYPEVNACFNELKKTADSSAVAEISKKVEEFNLKYRSENRTSGAGNNAETKAEVAISAKKAAVSLKMKRIFLASFFISGLLIFPFALKSDYYEPVYMTIILTLTAISSVALILFFIYCGLSSTWKKKHSAAIDKAFTVICQNEEKQKYLGNICEKRLPNGRLYYKGQVSDNLENGFGAVILINEEMIYVGEFKNGIKAGIGKLYSNDLRSKLEGEFVNNQANGIADVIWDDGSAFHGEYMNNLPYNGKGKAVINNKAVIGCWKNGVKVSDS